MMTFEEYLHHPERRPKHKRIGRKIRIVDVYYDSSGKLIEKDGGWIKDGVWIAEKKK